MHRRNHGRREYHDDNEPALDEMMRHDPSLIEYARHTVAEMDMPGTPDVQTARVLRVHGVPEQCGTRTVRDVRVADGRPEHGELRSDDHISTFEVEIPLSDVHPEYADDFVCECGSERAVYRYNAYHHIAGSEMVFCPTCDTVHHSEEWG